MRISDWSSDVCSSDLGQGDAERDHREQAEPEDDRRSIFGAAQIAHGNGDERGHDRAGEGDQCADAVQAAETACKARSEEHTSELQSLMRISYAVFCLKKKKKEKKEIRSRERNKIERKK